MHIMFIPSWYANERNKVHGSFFKEQALAIQEVGINISVAYNEIWPITLLGKIKEKRGLSFKVEDGLRTYRYKDFNFIPKHPLMFKVFNKRMDRLYKEIIKKEGKIDLIHAHSSLWGGISAAYISEKYNIPLIITEHSSVERGPFVRKSYLSEIINSYRSANKVITVGNGLKKEIEVLSRRSDIEVIGNLVDLNNFYIDNSKVNNEYFTFFSLAFLEGEKGFDTLIKAFAEAFKEEEKVRLHIGGDGSQRQWLEGLVNEFGIKEKVRFLGAMSRTEVAKVMSQSNCFVLPSRNETFGVVYIEALASGIPVIGTYNGGAEDIVNNKNGYLVPIDNVLELSNAMKNIIGNINDFNSEILRQDVVDRFSPSIITNKIISVYNEVLSKGDNSGGV